MLTGLTRVLLGCGGRGEKVGRSCLPAHPALQRKYQSEMLWPLLVKTAVPCCYEMVPSCLDLSCCQLWWWENGFQRLLQLQPGNAVTGRSERWEYGPLGLGSECSGGGGFWLWGGSGNGGARHRIQGCPPAPARGGCAFLQAGLCSVR